MLVEEIREKFPLHLAIWQNDLEELKQKLDQKKVKIYK